MVKWILRYLLKTVDVGLVFERVDACDQYCHTPNSTCVIYVTILPPDFFFHNLSLNSTWSNHLET